MPTISFRDKLKYRFDNFMSKGTGALILALLIFSVAIILVASAIVLLFNLDDGGGDLPQQIWNNLNRIIDAGYLGGDEGNWPFLILMLAVTAGGIFIFSTLIGVLTTGLEDKIDQLRKGRSFVAESGHTVILGWSPQVFSVVQEIILANESLKRACIAVLADKDKVEMEDELRDRIEDTLSTKIVCRTGDPVDMDDLSIVNPTAARSVIILPEHEPGSDAATLKTVLALNNIMGDTDEGPHISALIRDSRNLPAAKVAGGGRAVFLTATEIIARITAQTSRQSGLSVVATDVLDFSGDEIYFHRDDALTGMLYRQAIQAFDESAALGVRRASGDIQLNPSMDSRIDAGDSLIVLAEDDDKVVLSRDKEPAVDESAINLSDPPQATPEKTLLLGWNVMGPPLVHSLDGYVAGGSSVHIVAPTPPETEALAGELVNTTPSVQIADTTDRAVLDSLSVTDFHQVIVLSQEDLEPSRADAATLATLLHLRDIADTNNASFPIITEIFDRRTQDLARTARADDFIVSDRLLSLMLAQVSENRELAVVFDELFSSEGAEFYIRPVTQYLESSATVNFHTLVEAAARKNQTAVGYRLAKFASDPDQDYGVRLNPAKSESVTFSADDMVIVLADD
ncbi:MAG: potassium transporter TrkA [Desulfovibrio sp.]|nr:MAG: potassium transporter TrkA [Desulfovibrio sp.]